jgi:hypothetical protein
VQVGWASLQALCGLAIGLLAGAHLGVGPAIGSLAQRMVGIYELGAPVLLFVILGPSMLKLLRQDRGEPRRFTIFAVVWFSLLRLTVCLAATLAVTLLYRLPLSGPTGTVVRWGSMLTLSENRYVLSVAAACLTAWLLRHRTGRAVDLFLRLPDFVEGAGNFVTRLTPLFGFLVGVYIVSLPDMLTSAIGRIPGAALHPVSFRWFSIGAGDVMTAYLAVTAITALLCFVLHASLLTWARLALPRFSVRGYLSGYLIRVYPLIWSTGAESLAIPANLAILRRYGGGMPDALRDLTAGLAATLNLNGTLICCLVLMPAVCMAIGHPLSAGELLACLPLIFGLGYAIPGIPGELAIFADPIAQALGLSGGERDLFLLLFLSWQIGLTDSFRSAGSATDAVPATLLLTHDYRNRHRPDPAFRTPQSRP